MKRRDFIKVSLAASALLAIPAGAEGSVNDNFKVLDPIVGKALEAYNAKDWKKFYANWADQVKAMTTEQTFNALFVGMYHKQFGAYKSRKLIEGKSSFADLNGLLVYEAQFAVKKATLSVNFFKEGSAYKIQQMRFDPA